MTTHNAIFMGCHFYHPCALAEHFTALVSSFFASAVITNAEHPYFLSAIQSFASWWACYLNKPDDDDEVEREEAERRAGGR